MHDHPDHESDAPEAAEAEDDASGSLLRQAVRAAVLSLAGTPGLLAAALIERWVTTR